MDLSARRRFDRSLQICVDTYALKASRRNAWTARSRLLLAKRITNSPLSLLTCFYSSRRRAKRADPGRDSMTGKIRLAELQLAIMNVLWDQGEVTVAQVRQSLKAADRPLAHTTIATMLSRMETERHVEHRSEGRANIYRPLLRREAVSRTMVSDLASRLFGGDVTQMVAHLLADTDVTPEEIVRLKRLVRDKEKEVNDGQ